jgi:hypothetical protein
LRQGGRRGCLFPLWLDSAWQCAAWKEGHVVGAANERTARSALSERAGPDTGPPRRSGKNGIGIRSKEPLSVEVDNVVGILGNPDFRFP